MRAIDKNIQFDKKASKIIEITLVQAVKAKKKLNILYLNFNNMHNENYVSFKFERKNALLINTYITIIDTHKNFEWSGFGINGVLSIERILNAMNIDSYYFKAPNDDGLGIYFWTRCGYRPVLKEQYKILDIQPVKGYTYFVKSAVNDT